jgi:hypothetical protein
MGLPLACGGADRQRLEMFGVRMALRNGFKDVTSVSGATQTPQLDKSFKPDYTKVVDPQYSVNGLGYRRNHRPITNIQQAKLPRASWTLIIHITIRTFIHRSLARRRGRYASIACTCWVRPEFP